MVISLKCLALLAPGLKQSRVSASPIVSPVHKAFLPPQCLTCQHRSNISLYNSQPPREQKPKLPGPQVRARPGLGMESHSSLSVHQRKTGGWSKFKGTGNKFVPKFKKQHSEAIFSRWQLTQRPRIGALNGAFLTYPFPQGSVCMCERERL